MANNPILNLNFEKYLMQNNADITHGSGTGWEFEDIKVGSTFFFTPKWFICNYGFLRNIDSLDLLRLIFQMDSVSTDFSNPFENHKFIDKYKIIKKFERVKNKNPYIERKQKDYPKIEVKNLRTKKTFNINEDYLNLVYFDDIIF